MKAVDIFLVYQFLKRLALPFNKWEAFKTGVIDENGKVLIKKENRTNEQSDSWGYYDVMIANLKKMLATIPGGKSAIASYAAALILLREEDLSGQDLETLLTEEIANVTSNVAGAAPGDEPVGGAFNKKKRKIMLRRAFPK